MYVAPIEIESMDGEFDSNVEFYSEDKAGNQEVVQYFLLRVRHDRTPPVTTIVVDCLLNPDGTCADTATVMLMATDDMSGVAQTRYTLDNWQHTQTYAQPLTFLNDGTYQLRVRSVDNNENKESIQTKSFTIRRPPPFGNIERVSLADAEAEANQETWLMAGTPVSADGRYVAMTSAATNLVQGDSNKALDVFVRDLVAGATSRVSVSSAGDQANHGSQQPRISADGQVAVFISYASNLVAGDTNGRYDIFVRDLKAGTTERVSVSSSGAQGDDHSIWFDMSADGRFIVFESNAANLVSGDTNQVSDIFLRDRQLGTTTRISLSSAGGQTNNACRNPRISANGQYTAFVCAATNVVQGDSNGLEDLFLYDRVTGKTKRVSVATNGAQINVGIEPGGISADGRYVGFATAATTLVEGDNPDSQDAFVYDTVTGKTTRVNLSYTGQPGNQKAGAPFFTPDGKWLFFTSDASNLVPRDQNGRQDVFMRSLP